MKLEHGKPLETLPQAYVPQVQAALDAARIACNRVQFMPTHELLRNDVGYSAVYQQMNELFTASMCGPGRNSSVTIMVSPSASNRKQYSEPTSRTLKLRYKVHVVVVGPLSARYCFWVEVKVHMVSVDGGKYAEAKVENEVDVTVYDGCGQVVGTVRNYRWY